MVTEGTRSLTGSGPRTALVRSSPRELIEGDGSIAGMVMRASVVACACLIAGALGGCTLITDSFLTNEFSGDPYPINVDTSSGAIIVGMRTADTEQDAVLDLLSPLTLSDPCPTSNGAPCATTVPSVSYVDLTLLGIAPAGGGYVPRARFTEPQVVSLHPCDPRDPEDPSDPDRCNVGTQAAPRSFKGIIGADMLAGDAVRLRLGDDQIFVLPDVGGSDRGRSLDCDAVFDSPYRGGGTLVFPTTELPFGNRRITLQACLGQDPDPGPTSVTSLHQSGTDALLVVSTSIGISILGEAAYQRYRIAHPTAPPFDDLDPGSVYLPSGLITGRIAKLDRLALVATSTSNALAPCRQLYAHRLLTTTDLTRAQCQRDGNGNNLFDCPCENGDTFCAVPAILELTPPTPMPASFDVLVVPDTDPTLQALRTELRPDQSEVDGILGTNVLSTSEIDVDYPHDRLLARCPGDNCSARPQLSEKDDRCQINRCINNSRLDPKTLPYCQ